MQQRYTFQIPPNSGNPWSDSTEIHGTAVTIAAWFGQLEVLTLLLDAHADPNDVNRTADICSPLTAAAARGHVACAGLLIARGADVNSWRYPNASPLLVASKHGCAELVQMLMCSGAVIQGFLGQAAGGGAFNLPLHEACLRGHNNAVMAMVASG